MRQETSSCLTGELKLGSATIDWKFNSRIEGPKAATGAKMVGDLRT